LKGRFHWNKRGKEDLERGIQYFQQAINLDPNFALAYVGISDTYSVLPTYPYLPPKEAFPRAKTAAQRALEIDPTLAEAHNAMANVLAVYEWNWVEAEKEFKRALELNPNSANIHYNYAQNYLVPMGRLDEAIAEMKLALKLEPLSLIINTNLGAIYIWARQYDLGLEQTRKANDLEPNFRVGQFRLIEALIAKGMYDEAIALNQKLLQTDPESQHLYYRLGYAYAKAGHKREAEEVIGKLKDLSKREHVMNSRIARIYAALGEREMVFVLLERAYEARDTELPRLKVDAAYDLLRDDPRFQDLMRRIGLPQ
jgi:tetratricopeptide (TPR) repeat protein